MYMYVINCEIYICDLHFVSQIGVSTTNQLIKLNSIYGNTETVLQIKMFVILKYIFSGARETENAQNFPCDDQQ